MISRAGAGCRASVTNLRHQMQSQCGAPKQESDQSDKASALRGVHKAAPPERKITPPWPILPTPRLESLAVFLA